MAREHPRGCVFQAGAQRRYLIGSQHGWLGGLGFSAAAYALKDRDAWIGWDRAHRPRHLIVNLSRFLIRPAVHCRNLASWALSHTLRRLGDDFMRHSGYRPVLVESFVESQHYTGVSLLAAGWTRVGLTAGRGRFSTAGAAVPKRAIWCRPLRSDWRRVLGITPQMVVPRGCAEGLSRTVWAEHEFGGASLGDRRLSQRLVKSAGLMAVSPGESFATAAGGDPAAIAGYYRMIEQPAASELTVENILRPHTERTVQRIADQKSVLLIQDETDLNFATHGAAAGLGLIGKNKGSEGTLGLHLHSTMAVADTGIPLGLLRMEFDAQDPAGNDAQGQTQRWIRGVEDSAKAAQRVPDVHCLSVIDREGDIYALFDHCRQLANLDILVRARHDRRLGKGGPRLFETVRAAPAQARLEIEVRRRSARRAACELRWQAITIFENPRSATSRALPLTAVHLRETATPPDGCDPLEWLLLTTLTVRNAAEAKTVLNSYRLRWRIEDWHRILKSGCKAKFLNLQTAERLERAIAIKGVIAWRLHAMVLLGRETPDLPADMLFSELEIQVLRDVARKRKRPQPEDLGQPC